MVICVDWNRRKYDSFRTPIDWIREALFILSLYGVGLGFLISVVSFGRATKHKWPWGILNSAHPSIDKSLPYRTLKNPPVTPQMLARRTEYFI